MSILYNLLYLTFSAFLFFLSQPNILVHQGIGFLGFVELVPVFFVLKRITTKSSWLYGFFYGALSYGLLCYWLSTFNPYTLYLGLPAFGVIMALVFLFMKMFGNLFAGNKFYAMALVWLAYEFLKTKGFLGFPYGIVGYTQWKNIPLMQSAAVGGVWWVSAICVFSSAFFVTFAENLYHQKKNNDAWGVAFRVSFRKSFVANVVFLCALIFSFAYGIFSLNSVSAHLVAKKVVCVQNNTDSNKYGFEVYKRDVKVLMDLTDDAMKSGSGVDFVVWPETAVVPPIMYHYQKNIDPNRYNMVVDLLDFMDNHDACFVIGNQATVDNGGKYPDDYNASLVFDSRKKNVQPPEPETYYKMHLVPFTEYFPYERLFPRLYKLLLMGDTHLWTPGTGYTVFDSRGIKFSTPICFEDTFGDLCRGFVKNGARCLFNLTNDSWSKSVPCQFQHLSMSVFRAVENGVPMARSTASGATCFVDSKGRVKGLSEFFQRNYVREEILVPENYVPTLYNRFGDWLPVLEIAAVAALFWVGLWKRRKKN